MPLDTAIATYSGNRVDPIIDPEHARMIHVNLGNSLTLAAGTVLGELTATPGKFKAYASGNSDGSEVPKVILRYAAKSDASGNVSVGDAVPGEFGQVAKSVEAWYCGTFKTTELTGLDANAVAVLNARYVSGVLADGVIRIP